MSKTICPAVWHHLCINTRGSNRLCCNAVTQNEDWYLTNFKNHWHGLRSEVKQQMLNDERPEICQSCWNKEDLGIQSLRQGLIHKYKKSGRWQDYIDNLHTTVETPLELDLKLGNYCNLSCRMCNSYSSSKVHAENVKIYNETGINLASKQDNELNYKQDKWYLDPVFVARVKHYIDKGLLELKFTGGEPMMVPGVKEVIDYCIKTDRAKEITIQLITNGTLITQEWIDLLSKFKLCILSFSIDGTKETYEYIRYPTDWKDTYNRLKISHNSGYQNIVCNLTFTLQIYNMLEIKNMLHLTRNLKSKINCIPLDNPLYLDVKNAPISLKNDALNEIQKIKVLNNNEKTFINDIKNKIKQKPEDELQQKNKFLLYTKIRDPYRDQDFTKQKVYKYYE
jgi:sulfatase maturation enzyme AslB (radical SAM superfamily)